MSVMYFFFHRIREVKTATREISSLMFRKFGDVKRSLKKVDFRFLNVPVE